MNILLWTDSKIPNLALMKYSTYYKEKGHITGFNIYNPDLIIFSVIFKDNKWKALSCSKHTYPGIKSIFGGPGYDPKIKLPLKVEISQPDYSLYPYIKHHKKGLLPYKDSIGRVTSGCIRDCYFCLVPKMGKIRFIQHPKEFYRGGICRLLDDNLQAMPKKFKMVCEWAIKNNIIILFEGLDIRLINKESALLLKKIKHHGHLHFAFDNINYKESLEKGFCDLIEAGHRPSQLMFYIYCHDEGHLRDAMRRFEIIRGLGCDPYLMVNPDNLTDRLRRIRRIGIKPELWRYKTTEEVFA